MNNEPAKSGPQAGVKYPVVLVHGFGGYGGSAGLSKKAPYFGLFTKDAPAYIRQLGYDCCVPALGAVSSVWDRACELYAQVFGGRVDYGKVHAAKFNHERFGETYAAMLPQVGTTDPDGRLIKMNLITHSFGGPTARQFIELLANGSAEERDGTPDNELSPLFAGGKRQLVHSITTLAANHNGISVIETLGIMRRPIEAGFYALFAVLAGTRINRLYPVGLKQWGIDGFHVSALANMLRHEKDLGFYGCGMNSIADVTKDFHPFDNIYYFTYAGCRTFPTKKHGFHVPKPRMLVLLWASAIMEGFQRKPDWRPNDGMVNTLSARAPFADPQEFYDGASADPSALHPGIWYKLPVENKDHISYMGLGETRRDYYEMFRTILDRVSALPDAQ